MRNNYQGLQEQKNEIIINEEPLLADTSSPQLIKTFYNANFHVVADYKLTSNNADMTSAIQKALNQCSSNGGGTVWLERGIYKVSSPITIPSMCTLMGDWQDPDNYQGTLDYGTKIVVDVKTFKNDKSNLEQTGLFKMKSSSGVRGLTIYYKNQSATKPVAQPWTFYYTAWEEEKKISSGEPSMLFTIRDITLINAYRGIGRDVKESSFHEMLIIENVKGTALYNGVTIHKSSDVGTITGLYLKPKYWAKANLKAFDDSVANISESSIVSDIKSRGGKGLIITDVELSQYVDIEISGYKYGLYFPNPNDNGINTRGNSTGSIYNFNTSNCEYGIYASAGIHNQYGSTMINASTGYVISNSMIEGSSYAIYNNSNVIGGNSGTFKLNDVSINGKVGGQGNVIHYDSSAGRYVSTPKETNLKGKVNKSGKFSNLNTYRNLKVPGTNFVVLSNSATVDKINSTLSSVSKNGGGVVYLKPGKYSINKQITVPSNVELRGSSSVSTRIYKYGTVFEVLSDEKKLFRAVKIVGDNSGVSGINFAYKSSINLMKSKTPPIALDYAIFVENVKNVYVKNISFIAASYGIYFNKCDNITVENIVGTALWNFVRVDNTSNGMIRNILQNVTVLARNNYYCNTKNFPWSYGLDFTLNNLQFIYLLNSSNIELENCFAFRPKKFIEAENSKFYAVNVTHDDSMLGDTAFFINRNSNAVVVNAFRWSDCLPINNEIASNFGIYNMMKIEDVGESDILNSIFKISKRYISSKLILSKKSLSLNSTSVSEVSYTYEGDGKLSCTSSNEALIKCSVDLNKKVIKISPVKSTNGSVTISLKAAAGKNYSASTTSMTVSVNIKQVLQGDVNSDGKINALDYILVRKYLLGLTKFTDNQMSVGDMNKDKKINALDYINIRKLILGKN